MIHERQVPFFRPDISEKEIDEVVAALRSGWLTTGPRVKRFEREFAVAVKASHAVAVNSCTAALHLAVEAMDLRAGQGVLVPTMTFAASAEVVRYLGAIPILVDCDPVTLNMDLEDAARKTSQLRERTLPLPISAATKVVGVIPVHVGGLMMNVEAVTRWARRESLWIVEDAAHAFPAAWRSTADSPWRRCGEETADISCFSFYANKTMTTGEGGMAVTANAALANRMRTMSLHGLSLDAWERYSGGKTWDYRIVAAGYKYNMTDLAAALGIVQLAQAEKMRQERESIAHRYFDELSDIDEIELPPDDGDRVHSWHLFPIKLRLSSLRVDRNEFLDELKEVGVGCSVHWRPLHLHPYYQENFGWKAADFPVATETWERLISLPIFPSMREDEIATVVRALHGLCAKHRRTTARVSRAK